MDAATERLFALWTVPPEDRADPVADFAAFDQYAIELVDEVRTAGKVAVAFRHTARYVGPWSTPIWIIEPTGRMVNGIGIDILTDAEGVITEIWVLAD